MTNLQYTEILEFTKTLAENAGELIKKIRTENSFKKEYKNSIELVTSADIASDKYITGEIKKRFAKHKILSEELHNTISENDLNNSSLWIIDPIDGTVNYANNHMEVAISIAYAEKGEVKVGVVHIPFMNEMFTAVKGGGAYLNGKPIKVNNKKDLERSLIATGFSYLKNDRIVQLEQVKKVLMTCQDIRRHGAAAIDLCYVACGRVAGYYETVKCWDMAAGALIAKEAGAKVGHNSPVPPSIPKDLWGSDLVAATPEIYEKLSNLIKA